MTAQPRLDKLPGIPAYRTIASTIEHSIATGYVKPGDAIGTEAQLVEKFGVNRSTIRESIRLLEKSGLIRRERGRRLFACLPAAREISSQLSHALLMHEVSFRDVWESTHALESATVEYAAARATHEDLEALKHNVDCTMTETDPEVLCRLDMQFHGLIAHASRNKALQLSRDAATNLCYSSVTLILANVPPAVERLRQAHLRIYSAIATNDVELARVWMRRHTNDWRKGYIKAGRNIEAAIDWSEAQRFIATVTHASAKEQSSS